MLIIGCHFHAGVEVLAIFDNRIEVIKEQSPARIPTISLPLCFAVTHFVASKSSPAPMSVLELVIISSYSQYKRSWWRIPTCPFRILI